MSLSPFITREIDWSHPIEAFRAFASIPFAHLFHGGEKSQIEQKEQPGLSPRQQASRWSFIVANPVTNIIYQGGAFWIDGARSDASFDEVIRAHLRTQTFSSPIPFLSGLAGFIGYESAALFEPSLELPPSPYALPDIALGRYEGVIIFDRWNERSFVCGLNARAVDELCEIIKDTHLQTSRPSNDENPDLSNGFEQNLTVSSNFDRGSYKDAVEQVREAILNGDFFQTNLTRRIIVDITGLEHFNNDHIEMFARIMDKSDACYGACLQFDEGIILSNSPEKFFSLSLQENGRLKLIAEPIKGTIARDSDPAKDKELRDLLKNNPKDRAENIMIADLLRNDMSRVCDFDSIAEEEICAVLSLTHVHHLVSRITGTLCSGYDSVDVLRALFPCGSITGAPKVEAMKIIASTEKTGRGPYCGAIGYIDDRGSADFSVSIRTMMKMFEKNSHNVSIPVGGGITLRSDPNSEYEETSLKARALMSMFNIDPDIY